MSGSRLGRGRVGRLALLTCGLLTVVFIIFLYRSASFEMARLRDLHVKCAQQQEALAAQLQVIYEYKVQLEKTLSNEKSANAAVKEELQQKALKERSQRDKDSLEAMQRFNALQQNYKLLQTEHQDLKEDCKKKEDVALDNSKSLESTLKELRIQLKRAAEDKGKALQHLKTKYMDLEQEKIQWEEKYSNLKKMTGDSNVDVERLQKQVIQLQRELDGAKKVAHFSIGSLNGPQILPRRANEAAASLDNNIDKPAILDNNRMQVIRPSSQQQVSPSISDELQAGQNPQPLQAPQNYRHLIDAPENNGEAKNYDPNINDVNVYKIDDTLLPNEIKSDVMFENRDGNIVPVGPNDGREQYVMPLPYENQRQEEQRVQAQAAAAAKMNDTAAQVEIDQVKQVLAPPNYQEKPVDAKEEQVRKEALNNLSSKGPMLMPILRPQAPGQSAQVDNENVRNVVGELNDFD